MNNLLFYLIQVLLWVSLELVNPQETDKPKVYGQIPTSYIAKLGIITWLLHQENTACKDHLCKVTSLLLQMTSVSSLQLCKHQITSKLNHPK